MNKGRIHREIRDFWEIFWNSIKSDDKLKCKITEIDIFVKRPQRKIHGIKNHSIWIKIREEINEWIREKFLNAKREKSEIKNKII